MASQASDSPTCPVDPASRAAWLEKAKETTTQQTATAPTPKPPTTLSTTRETSSIPRAISQPPTTTTPSPTSLPATPSSSADQNWIYPSQKMFFAAMQRKSHSPHAPDMATIVPIHNAVNERAWAEIKAWEARFVWTREANRGCGGPRLRSFAGDSGKISPRARWKGWVGYQGPFDRHDWVVERCGGGEVEYVIDFYKGKEEGKGLSFYLDVRPKLNSWEGWKMRVWSMLGIGG